jgi:hypothetical protein
MTCKEVRELLPTLLYDNPPPADADAVRTHLASCSACSQEYAELERVRHALDSVPVPPVSVNVSCVFQQAAVLQQRRARRLRRATVAVCALAAALLLVVLLRLEIRFDAHQLVLRWGDASKEQPLIERQPAPEPTVIVQREVVTNPEVEEQLRVIRDMVHALAGSLDTRDARVWKAVGQVETRLEALRLQDTRRWSENDRYISALYKTIFPDSQRGEKQ